MTLWVSRGGSDCRASLAMTLGMMDARPVDVSPLQGWTEGLRCPGALPQANLLRPVGAVSVGLVRRLCGWTQIRESFQDVVCLRKGGGWPRSVCPSQNVGTW